jgi:NADP-dependent 3-hydroxy acid dehydrogenase YdfG
LYMTRLVSPAMVERRRGHIINVGSSAGKEVYPKGNVYCATKFAVDALSRAMRVDLHKFGVRVSQVSPGHVEETEFALTRFDGDAERAKIYSDFQPLKSSDVAEAIYFMATRPPHVNVQDLYLFGAQQANSLFIDRSGRG